MADGPRVPLRRLSTARFKTLAQRNEDNARRRARTAADRQGIPWSNIRQNLRVTDVDIRVPWSGIATTLKAGKYAEAVAVVERTRRRHNQWLRNPTEPIPEGKDEWDNRDEDLPEELYYYHGMFG